jgi:hypothetical protein
MTTVCPTPALAKSLFAGSAADVTQRPRNAMQTPGAYNEVPAIILPGGRLIRSKQAFFKAKHLFAVPRRTKH